MPYDSHPATIAWFKRALAATAPETRWRAIEILRYFDGPRRDDWLLRAQDDPDPRVAMTAVLVGAALVADGRDSAEDLFESDFAEGMVDESLRWEWEYSFIVCQDLYAPNAGWLVWTRREDDDEARRLALLRAGAGVPEPSQATAIVVGKRFVNRYTRSPRGYCEAMKWRTHGRPRYEGNV